MKGKVRKDLQENEGLRGCLQNDGRTLLIDNQRLNVYVKDGFPYIITKNKPQEHKDEALFVFHCDNRTVQIDDERYGNISYVYYNKKLNEKSQNAPYKRVKGEYKEIENFDDFVYEFLEESKNKKRIKVLIHIHGTKEDQTVSEEFNFDNFKTLLDKLTSHKETNKKPILFVLTSCFSATKEKTKNNQRDIYEMVNTFCRHNKGRNIIFEKNLDKDGTNLTFPRISMEDLEKYENEIKNISNTTKYKRFAEHLFKTTENKRFSMEYFWNKNSNKLERVKENQHIINNRLDAKKAKNKYFGRSQ